MRKFRNLAAAFTTISVENKNKPDLYHANSSKTPVSALYRCYTELYSPNFSCCSSTALLSEVIT